MTLPRRPFSKRTERLGINFVRAIVEEQNCLFHEIAQGNDYGNDAFIELVNNQEATGRCVALQIKSGISYFAGDEYRIPYTERHAEYWRRHSLPVLGVVFHPIRKRAYWVDLSSAVGRHGRGGGTASFPMTELAVFDQRNFRDIILPVLLKKSPHLTFQRACKFAQSADLDEHHIGVRSLLYSHRNNLKAWNVLEHLLLTRTESDLDPFVAVAFAHVHGHADIFWRPDNTIDEPVRQVLRQRISRWNRAHLVRLLGLVDENGVERGTVGQHVYATVDHIEGAASLLASAAFDADLPETMRVRALYLHCFVAQRDAVPLLIRAQTDPVLADLAVQMGQILDSHGGFSF